jgi:hypothetical protein
MGRDAGRRVLSGRIERGVAERISAVLWFSDLRGYTRITDTAAPDQIIPLLNDYAEIVISAIHAAGGDVLKLIGDGTLAIFHGNDIGAAAHAALGAALLVRQDIGALNVRRSKSGLPVTEVPFDCVAEASIPSSLDRGQLDKAAPLGLAMFLLLRLRLRRTCIGVPSVLPDCVTFP